MSLKPNVLMRTLPAQDKRTEERLAAQEIPLASQDFETAKSEHSSPSGLVSQRVRCPGAMIKGEVNSTMAHVVTLPTAEPTTTHNEHHGLPPFAAPMLILFGVFVVWLLIAGIVLYVLV